MERTQQENHVLVAKLRRIERLFAESNRIHAQMIQQQDAEILRLIRENHQLRIATAARETREGGAQ